MEKRGGAQEPSRKCIRLRPGGKDLLLPNQVVVLIQFAIDRGIEGVGNK